MNNQKGFTLIELIVVIVILGILSAVAVPKFISVQDEAKKATVEGARGAVASAMALAHARSVMDGSETATTVNVVMDGVNVAMAYGWPTVAGIVIAANINSADFTNTTGVITRNADGTADAGEYRFTYTAATSATVPATVSAVTK